MSGNTKVVKIPRCGADKGERTLIERGIMREPNYETRDGFQVRQNQFNLPSNSTNLDAKAKRAVTICNLFINHRLTISDIARVLDDEYGAVISALIKRGLIKERRQHRGQPPQGIERRKHHCGEVMGSDSGGSNNQLK
jgi:hypothetical protein